MTVNVSKPVVNVREKLAELDKPTGIAGEAMLRAETPQEQFNLIGAGRRNLIINGDMQVWQRGTSFTGISNGQYTADRWAVQRTGTANVTRTSTGLNGFPYALRITATSSSSIKPIYWIEMNNALYVGQTVTLSFWARASANNFNYDITGYNGTSSEVWAYTDDLGGLTTEWKKFTITKPLTIDGVSNHYRLHWVDNGLSGDWLEITGVQLELGKVATPFEHRSFGEELVLCKRYFEKSFAYSVTPANNVQNLCIAPLAAWGGSSAAMTQVHFEVEKRTTPTLTKYGNSNGYLGYLTAGSLPTTQTTVNYHQNLSLAALGTRGFRVNNQVTQSTMFGIYGAWTADAEL